jgi:hypothetical protein
MRRNPPELIIATILEGYRQKHRILAEGKPMEGAPYIVAGLFKKAQADGKLPDDVDVSHLAQLAQSLVTEGARHWPRAATETPRSPRSSAATSPPSSPASAGQVWPDQPGSTGCAPATISGRTSDQVWSFSAPEPDGWSTPRWSATYTVDALAVIVDAGASRLLLGPSEFTPSRLTSETGCCGSVLLPTMSSPVRNRAD